MRARVNGRTLPAKQPAQQAEAIERLEESARIRIIDHLDSDCVGSMAAARHADSHQQIRNRRIKKRATEMSVARFF
ncbi:hypothetical protein CI15_22820 [Paraburkholderia monticola]|uniref:Uncharacterized protein n=1 Tax=Paraburkholderia monticola TaxID=1399968 RepID=A0A149PJA9_9BURK|nr:hypothetical protein [Paraburkholderia monticola]KXU85118.1 hypothetical protein CI15_22820 [Paraburkholderia monticola]